MAKKKDEEMTHLQMIAVERKLTQKEVASCGTDLAKEELQLDQVRKEKKEADRKFTDQIKDHLATIMQLSSAIDTGILNENVECEVVIDRDSEVKYCTPKSGGKTFELPLSPEDYDLLT